MNILVVSRCSAQFPKSDYGADNLSLEVVRSLAEMHHVRFVARGSVPDLPLNAIIEPVKSKIELKSRVRFYYFFKGFLLEILATLKAMRVIKKWNPEVVIAFSSVSALIIKLFLKRTKVYYSINDTPISSLEALKNSEIRKTEKFIRFFLNNYLEKYASKAADVVVATSPKILRQMRTMLGQNKRIELGLPKARQEFVNECSYQNQGVINRLSSKEYVLSVGNLDGRKRADILIEAFAHVKSPLELVLAGDGPKLADYKRLVSRLGLGDRVHFVGYVEITDLVKLFKNSCMVVLASSQEGFPTIIHESVLLEKPFIYITDDKTFFDGFIEDSNSALQLLNSFNPIDIAQKVDQTFQSSKSQVSSSSYLLVADKLRSLSLVTFLAREFQSA